MGSHQHLGRPGVLRHRSRRWTSKLRPAVLLVLIGCARCLAFLPSSPQAPRSLNVAKYSSSSSKPQTEEATTTTTGSPATEAATSDPEAERQRLSAERVAALKAAVDEGDFGKIISALGLPLWLLPVVEIVIAVLELGLIYAGIKLLPPEFFSFLPQEVRSFLQIGTTETQ
mmetsp:Transcript_1472/g.3056  ORF Transcript_1472/g.3056 Transcript_1472/m.3056 type:complete len:171 (+) Transcript_1472:36-548(+)